MRLLGAALENCSIKDSYLIFDRKYSDEELMELYGELNEALFECRIPFSKPIGFIVNMATFSFTTPIANSSILGMSPIEFGFNLDKIGFRTKGGTIWSSDIPGALCNEGYEVPDEDKKISGTSYMSYFEKIIRPKFMHLGDRLSYLICRPFNETFFSTPSAEPYNKKINEMLKNPDAIKTQELRDLVLEKNRACDVEPRNVMYFTKKCRSSIRQKELDVMPDYISDFHVSTAHFSTGADRSGIAYIGIVCLEGIGKRSITDNQEILNLGSGKCFATSTVYDLTDYFTVWYPSISIRDGVTNGLKLNIKEGVDTEVIAEVLRNYGRKIINE